MYHQKLCLVGIFSHHSLLGSPFNRDVIQSLSTLAYTHILNHLIHGRSLGILTLWKCVSQCSLEKQNQQDMYREIYYEEFDHAIMGFDNCNISRTNVHFESMNSKASNCQRNRKRRCSSLENSLIQGRVSVLFCSRPSTDRIIYIRQSTFLSLPI